ncbi:MAG: YggS family pyridoxal phosphate-dependent enzyme [Dehalococcoidia bacterium]|nr:YggS family pyridoxal phosphate-dependent enzyme [Dehalococcoidia bacterium]
MSAVDIAANIAKLKQRIDRACGRASRSPEEVTIVAVTKTVPAPLVRAAFESGIRNFGENRVQEAEAKLDQLADIRKETTWHMVGHLQTNKAGRALEIFDVIQSVDSLRLAEVLNRRASRRLPVLLEVNVSGEKTKTGFRPDEITAAVGTINSLPNLEIRGLMTIAPIVREPEEARPYFRRLRELRDGLGLKEASMGMTDDFEIAIEEGATIIRIGRAIFGERI